MTGEQARCRWCRQQFQGPWIEESPPRLKPHGRVTWRNVSGGARADDFAGDPSAACGGLIVSGR